jgi:hypothetical protein
MANSIFSFMRAGYACSHQKFITASNVQSSMAPSFNRSSAGSTSADSPATDAGVIGQAVQEHPKAR